MIIFCHDNIKIRNKKIWNWNQTISKQSSLFLSFTNRTIYAMRLNFYLIYYSSTIVFCSFFRNEFNSSNKLNELNKIKLKQTIEEIIKTWVIHDLTLISHNDSLDNKGKLITVEITNAIISLCLGNYFQTSKIFKFILNDRHFANFDYLISCIVSHQCFL